MNVLEFQNLAAGAIRRKTFWQVVGSSWKGNTSKRDGNIVSCGHKHKSEAGCRKCLETMKRDRPGKCQTYRASHFTLLVFKKAKEGGQ